MTYHPRPWRPHLAPAPVFLSRCLVPTEAERLAAFRARLGRHRAEQTFRRARIDRALDLRIDRREAARSTGIGQAGTPPSGSQATTAAARTGTTDRAHPPSSGWRWAFSRVLSLALPGA